MKSQIDRWLLLLGVVGSAALGQFYFARKPEYFWDAVTFYGIAAALLLLLLRDRSVAHVAGKPTPSTIALEVWVRRELVGAALLLGALTIVMLVQPRGRYWPVFGLWVVAMMLCVLACLPRPNWSRQWLTGIPYTG